MISRSHLLLSLAVTSTSLLAQAEKTKLGADQTEGGQNKLGAEKNKAGAEPSTDQSALNLSREEIVKMQWKVGELIPLLFVRQFDVQANRRSPALGRPFVRRLHDPWPTAGNDGNLVSRELFTQLHGNLVIGITARGSC